MLTATELRIARWEREILPVVREKLLSNELTHGDETAVDGAGSKARCVFNMVHGGERGNCGTIACIGGWAWLLAKAKPNKNGKYNDGDVVNAHFYVLGYKPIHDPRSLTLLYYPNFHSSPHENDKTWRSITGAMAAEAIHNFLHYRNPMWSDIFHGITQPKGDLV